MEMDTGREEDLQSSGVFQVGFVYLNESRNDSGEGEQMKAQINITALWRVAVLALVFPISNAFAAGASSQASISKLLDQAKIHAGQANEDAAVLESYARSGLGWQMHAECLQAMKVHTTELLADLMQLKAMRLEGTPRQREAIDRLNPLMQSMTAALTTTIGQLNHGQGSVNMLPFRTQVGVDWVVVNRVYTHLREFTNENAKI